MCVDAEENTISIIFRKKCRQVMEDITQLIDNDYPVDAVYRDLMREKKRDNVPHQRLSVNLPLME